jgi:membrane-bound serine protease (ClpP class)
MFGAAALAALLQGNAFVRAAVPFAAEAAGQPKVVELQIDGEIEPIMAEYVDAGVDAANQTGAALILIRIDTPGGLDTAMRDIIQHILQSRVPVAVSVGPTGARAASAGFFILLSADIAAMTDGTHAGAASPLLAIGGVPVQVDETLRRKILNDATAYLRSYAERRGRNVTLAETAVTEGKAFTEKEALDGKLVDLVVSSQDRLLNVLNGRTIGRFDGTKTTLNLANLTVERIEMSARQRFLARIVQPDIFFVLLIVGVLGLYTEFTHPGLFAPGVLGGIALVLALFAMHLVPINAAGVLLIGLSLALFVLEAKYPTHGILGVGGAIALLLGAVILVRSPITGEGVSLNVALGATIPFALISIGLMRLVLRSRQWPLQTGREALSHERGEVVTPIAGPDGPGMVRVRGELWRARGSGPMAAGTRVRVVRVDGLTVRVEPLADEGLPAADGGADDERQSI